MSEGSFIFYFPVNIVWKLKKCLCISCIHLFQVYCSKLKESAGIQDPFFQEEDALVGLQVL